MQEKMIEDVTNFTCGHCKYCGKECKCIDHSVIHFARSCFSCDEYTTHHAVCSAFECVDYYPALYKEWKEYNGFQEWHRLYIEEWWNGRVPNNMGLIKAKPIAEGREVFDDVWEVPYEDFLNCAIMRDDGIHYVNYRHIERTRSNPVGYHWVNEGSGIITMDELYAKEKPLK